MLLSMCVVIINYPPGVVKRKAGKPFMSAVEQSFVRAAIQAYPFFCQDDDGRRVSEGSVFTNIVRVGKGIRMPSFLKRSNILRCSSWRTGC
jgi:hypothetical protein